MRSTSNKLLIYYTIPDGKKANTYIYICTHFWWFSEFIFMENSRLKAIFIISQNQISLQYFVRNSCTNSIHVIASVLCEIMLKSTSVSLKITKIGRNVNHRFYVPRKWWNLKSCSRSIQSFRNTQSISFQATNFVRTLLCNNGTVHHPLLLMLETGGQYLTCITKCSGLLLVHNGPMSCTICWSMMPLY